MRIIVNGTEHDVTASTLAEAIRQLDYGDAVLATALNGRFVPAAVHPATKLTDGDEIEIVAQRQGG